MGILWRYHCSGCGADHDIHLRTGQDYEATYAVLMQEVRTGRRGGKWKGLVTKPFQVFVNGENRLYLCPICGHWRVDHDLALYKEYDEDDYLDDDEIDAVDLEAKIRVDENGDSSRQPLADSANLPQAREEDGTTVNDAFVMPDDLTKWDSDYECIETFEHVCDQCGAGMSAVRTYFLEGTTLKCPTCGCRNKVGQMARW